MQDVPHQQLLGGTQSWSFYRSPSIWTQTLIAIALPSKKAAAFGYITTSLFIQVQMCLLSKMRIRLEANTIFSN